jgi:argininosuccinate lyase
MVRDLLAQGRDFGSLTAEEWRGCDARFGADIAARVTSRASVDARRTPQSTSPDAVANALAVVRAWVGEHGAG